MPIRIPSTSAVSSVDAVTLASWLSCSSCCWRLQPLLGVFAFLALKAKSELQQAADGAKHLQSVIADADQSKMEKRVGELSAHIDKAYPQTSSSIWSVATRLP